jgi:hypothetical protein
MKPGMRPPAQPLLHASSIAIRRVIIGGLPD